MYEPMNENHSKMDQQMIKNRSKIHQKATKRRAKIYQKTIEIRLWSLFAPKSQKRNAKADLKHEMGPQVGAKIEQKSIQDAIIFLVGCWIAFC